MDSAIDSASPTIRLPPNEVLFQVATTLNGHITDLAIDLPVQTTCRKALELTYQSLKDADRNLFLRQKRSRAHKQALRSLLQQPVTSSHGQSSAAGRGILQVRNTLPVSQIPQPSQPLPKVQQKLKENFRPSDLKRNPHVTVKATLEDGKIACVPGRLKMSAMDADPLEHDEFLDLMVEECMIDTGAAFCIISSDLVPTSFYNSEAHAGYSILHRIGVQVNGIFSFSNSLVEVDTVFHLMPVSEIPNGRSGVILGQNGFLDRMVIRSIPRAILEARGEQVDERFWGDIVVESVVDLFGNLTEV